MPRVAAPAWWDDARGTCGARAAEADAGDRLFNSTSPGPNAFQVDAFRQELIETGYVEGGNLAIEYRWAEGRDDRLPEMAADLVSRNVDLIATAGGLVAARVAKNATSTIPIVFLALSDPVEEGLVASLARPAGNVTGAV